MGAAADIKAKMADKSFAISDMALLFKAVEEIAPNSEDLLDEIEDWDRKIQFKIENGPTAYMIFEGGKVSAGEGAIEYDVGYEIAESAALGILTGEKDATSCYMSGEMKIDGPIPDAMKLGEVLEIFREEMESA